VELLEQIRREHTHGVGTIQGVAKRFGVHRGWWGRRWPVRFRPSGSRRYGRGRAGACQGPFARAVGLSPE
jgi:hypothetical protein